MRSGLNSQFLTMVGVAVMGIACNSAGAQVVHEFASRVSKEVEGK